MVHIYTDGSFYNNKVSWAFGIVENNTISYIKTGVLYKIGYIKKGQLFGELFAVLKAIEYAAKNNINRVVIYYDFVGIQSLFLNRWNSKNPNIIKLKNRYDKIVKENNISVIFIKVEAHRGLNLIVDRAARDVLH